ncbi:hypothetical protein GGR57DRAFT_422001 [Xylariaceae sp. FL1272]|nr:hypothetical protein GGR57DRAFT_422001 [Xylariaceae sp. FL1272]
MSTPPWCRCWSQHTDRGSHLPGMPNDLFTRIQHRSTGALKRLATHSAQRMSVYYQGRKVALSLTIIPLGASLLGGSQSQPLIATSPPMLCDWLSTRMIKMMGPDKWTNCWSERQDTLQGRDRALTLVTAAQVLFNCLMAMPREMTTSLTHLSFHLENRH